MWAADTVPRRVIVVAVHVQVKTWKSLVWEKLLPALSLSPFVLSSQYSFTLDSSFTFFYCSYLFQLSRFQHHSKMSSFIAKHINTEPQKKNVHLFRTNWFFSGESKARTVWSEKMKLVHYSQHCCQISLNIDLSVVDRPVVQCQALSFMQRLLYPQRCPARLSPLPTFLS